MRIGYLCGYSEEEIAFASSAGFGSIELLVGPGGPLDPATTSDDAIQKAKDAYAAADIEVSAIGHYCNHLDPDEAVARANHEYFVSLFRLAEKMGVDCVCTFAGRDPEKDVLDNIPRWKQVWAPTVKLAQGKGIKIGFENCPMFHYFPFRGINIAYTPLAWDAMFSEIDSPNLGLEWDASHLVCLLIDYLQTIYDYGSKIVHVHAKDAEVIDSKVKRNGILEPGAVRHRTPGMGIVDWAAVCSALVEVGYKGNLDIEGRHDPVYHGMRENEGLVISLQHLKQFTKPEWWVKK